LTNQPPGNGETDPALAAAQAATNNESSSALRNFELDKTITHTRQLPGNIRRLSAAVVIDDRLETSAEGELIRTPLTELELAEYTQLAREAVGFSEQRGDSVVVFNRSFQPVEEMLPIEPLPLWQQSWVWTMVRQGLIGLTVLLLFLMVLRPAVKRLMPAPLPVALPGKNARSEQADPGHSRYVTNSDGTRVLTLDSPPVIYGDILNLARALAAEDPKRVAKVVKDWVSEN
jgi:flagellar M-ring protein FliF